MSSLLIFALVLGVLIAIHEFGHFIMAKWVGVRVEKFSIGFGPVLFGRKYGDTEYCLSLLPLGGFVKLAGESPEDAKGYSWEFESKGLFHKFLIVVAGPLMNAFLAFVLFAFIFATGQPTSTNQIGRVLPDTPAKTAGLQEGDRILRINGEPVSLWSDILQKIQSDETRASGSLTFTIARDENELEVLLQPTLTDHKDIFGKPVRLAFVGIAPSNEMVHIKHGFLEALRLGAERVWMMATMILYSLWLMVTGAMPFKDSVAGPIGIFFMTKDAASLGVAHLFYFTGSLSVSLFVLNLLPIPVLDGGHLLFIVIEKIKGSPLKTIVKERMTQAGMFALLILMCFVILQDMQRFEVFQSLKTLLQIK